MTTQTLVLQKDRWLHVFRYTPGNEGQMMDHLWRLAEDERTEVDWVDAAMLTFQIICRAGSTPRAPVAPHPAAG